MTDYIHIQATKRNFVIRATLPNLSKTLQTIAQADNIYITRTGDTYITRTGDTYIPRNLTTGYPRSIKAKKRNFVIRAKVNGA